MNNLVEGTMDDNFVVVDNLVGDKYSPVVVEERPAIVLVAFGLLVLLCLSRPEPYLVPARACAVHSGASVAKLGCAIPWVKYRVAEDV